MGRRGGSLPSGEVTFNISLAVGMFVWAGIIGWETFLSGRMVADVSAPAIFPSIICLLLVSLGIVLIVDSLRGGPADEAETTDPGEVSDGGSARIRILGVLTCLVGYAALMPILGFYLATPLGVIAIAWIAGMRNPITLILYAAIFMALLYAFFTLLLRIPLPPGITYGWSFLG
jgi:hypothetical protein